MISTFGNDLLSGLGGMPHGPPPTAGAAREPSLPAPRQVSDKCPTNNATSHIEERCRKGHTATRTGSLCGSFSRSRTGGCCGGGARVDRRLDLGRGQHASDCTGHEQASVLLAGRFRPLRRPFVP